MRNIYLFNPENDLAIAHGKKRYDAPKPARRLASDMSLLPVWYAQNDANSLILMQCDIPSDYMKDIFDALKISAKWVSEDDYVYSSDDVFIPWGWSPALEDRLEHLCGGKVSMPDLAAYRKLSGRQFAVAILKQMQAKRALDARVKIPVVASSLEDLSNAVESFHSACLMKSPWSGSGKGLLWVRSGWTDSVAAWCNNVLKRQGEVVCEPRYTKLQDFAMEFRVSGTELTFVGYSYFQTDDAGTYRGNLLASDERIEQLLAEYVSTAVLDEARTALMEILSEHLAPHYEGYFGIDMMICDSPEGVFLHPCVELNLRYNMGVVAHVIFERYVALQAVGRYTIWHGSDSTELRAFVSQMKEEHPLVIKDGKIERGFLPLTYIRDESEFMAYCLIGPICRGTPCGCE